MTTTATREDKAWYNQFYGERPDREVVVPRRIVERYRRPPHPELFHKTVGPGVGIIDRLRDKLTGRRTG